MNYPDYVVGDEVKCCEISGIVVNITYDGYNTTTIEDAAGNRWSADAVDVKKVL